MSLTDDFKTGKLESGWYYIKNNKCPNVYPDYYYKPVKMWRFSNYEFVETVYGECPSYEEYLESEAHCAVYSEENERLKAENEELKHFDGKNVCAENQVLRLKVSPLEEQNAELIETNASLSSQIKHLLDLQKEEGKEVEELRDLLKKLKRLINEYSMYFDIKDFNASKDLLTRINAAIGESEE